MFLYVGPGVGAATIIIVGIVLLLVLSSFVFILWRPIKKWITAAKKFFTK